MSQETRENYSIESDREDKDKNNDEPINHNEERQTSKNPDEHNQRGKPNEKIGIFNLPRDTSKKDIERLCEGFGEIESITMPMDYRTNTFRGYAFIVFKRLEDAEEAYNKLPGTFFRENQIRVDYSLSGYQKKPKRDYERRGYGGYRGHGRERFDGDRYRGGRYGGGRYGGDRYGGDRYSSGRYGGDRDYERSGYRREDKYGSGRYGGDSYGDDRGGYRRDYETHERERRY